MEHMHPIKLLSMCYSFAQVLNEPDFQGYFLGLQPQQEVGSHILRVPSNTKYYYVLRGLQSNPKTATASIPLSTRIELKARNRLKGFICLPDLQFELITIFTSGNVNLNSNLYCIYKSE